MDRSSPFRSHYRRLADLLDRHDPGDAFDEFVRTVPRGDEVLTHFLKTRTACWRLLLPDELTGRCLVCGFRPGQCGVLLASIVSTVSVLSPCAQQLRVTNAIAETENVALNTVQGTLLNGPFEPDSFDTIVVTATRSELDSILEALDELLVEDGTLVVLTNGFPRELRLTDFLGVEHEPVARDATATSAIRSTKRSFDRLFARTGFDERTTFARLSSSRRKNEWVFDVSDHDVVKWVFRKNRKAGITGPLRVGKTVARVSDRLGVLEQCYPEYLFVVKRTGPISTRRGLLMSGRNRSTVLDVEDGAVTNVVKVPNSIRQSVFNSNEETITSHLQEWSELSAISPTEIEPSRFGPQLREEPINGLTLKHWMDSTPKAIERTGRIAVDWLVEMQRTCRGPKNVLERDDLSSLLAANVTEWRYPDSLPDRVELFESPVHGDYFSSNIYVESGEVVRVIDWERGSLGGNPVVDPAFFLLQYAEYVGDSFEDGFRTVFVDDDRYSAVVASLIERYCEGVGVTPEAFLTCLPYAYLRRIPIAKGVNWRLDIDWSERVECILKHHDELEQTILGDGRPR